MPWISTRNRKPKYGSCCAIQSLLSCGFVQTRARRILDHLEDDEFSRMSRHDCHLNNELSQSDDSPRIQGCVYLNTKRLLWRSSEKVSCHPELRQKIGYQSLDLLPGREIVGLEHEFARALAEGLLDVQQQAPDVDVPPGRPVGRRDSSRSPDDDASAGKRPDHVDARLIERALVRVAQEHFYGERTRDGLVRGGMGYVESVVIIGVDSGGMSRGWY